MMRRVLAAYAVEFANAIRLRSTYVGPLLVAVAVALMTFQYPLSKDSVTDFGFIAVAMPTAIDLVGVFVLVVYCGMLISVDMGSGLIRLVLVSPLRRREYLISKLLMGWTYALVLMLVALLVASLLALIFGELTGIYYGASVIYTGAQMRNSLLIALGLNVLPLFATVSFALLISSLTQSRTFAIILALSVWIALDLLKQPLGFERYYFSTYLEHSWDVFSDRCNALSANWIETAPMAAGVSTVWIFGCALFSMLILARRDFSQ